MRGCCRRGKGRTSSSSKAASKPPRARASTRAWLWPVHPCPQTFKPSAALYEFAPPLTITYFENGGPRRQASCRAGWSPTAQGQNCPAQLAPRLAAWIGLRAATAQTAPWTPWARPHPPSAPHCLAWRLEGRQTGVSPLPLALAVGGPRPPWAGPGPGRPVPPNAWVCRWLDGPLGASMCRWSSGRARHGPCCSSHASCFSPGVGTAPRLASVHQHGCRPTGPAA